MKLGATYWSIVIWFDFSLLLGPVSANAISNETSHWPSKKRCTSDAGEGGQWRFHHHKCCWSWLFAGFDHKQSQTQYESEIPSEVVLQHLHSSRIKKCKAGSRPPERMVDWRCLSPIIPTGQLLMATMRTNQRYWKFWRTADGETDVCFNFWSWSNFDTGKEISNIPPWLSQTTSAEWCVSVPRQWNLMTNKSPAIKEFSTANPSSCLLRHCPNFPQKKMSE